MPIVLGTHVLCVMSRSLVPICLQTYESKNRNLKVVSILNLSIINIIFTQFSAPATALERFSMGLHNHSYRLTTVVPKLVFPVTVASIWSEGIS